jgi:AcrR family transcriptional regulator
MAKNESKEKRINDILDAAVAIFVEKGYENTTMSEIASRAGMSKGGLYHYFLTKDMVLLYANQKLLDPTYEIMKQAENFNSIKEGLEFYISNYIKYWIDRKRELIFFSLSMTKAMSQKDIFNMYQKYIEKYITTIEVIYQKGIDSGEFISHNPRHSAVALISALDGVLVYMVLDNKLTLQEVVESFSYRFIEVFLQKTNSN